jgi:hypothetical protein
MGCTEMLAIPAVHARIWHTAWHAEPGIKQARVCGTRRLRRQTRSTTRTACTERKTPTARFDAD